jgi:hypothetical protein
LRIRRPKAWVAAHWGKPTQWAEQRGASTNPDYGLGYWANLAWHRLVRLKYPDELLAQTTLEARGQALGEWIVEAFERLAQNAPPQSASSDTPDSGLTAG